MRPAKRRRACMRSRSRSMRACRFAFWTRMARSIGEGRGAPRKGCSRRAGAGMKGDSFRFHA